MVVPRPAQGPLNGIGSPEDRDRGAGRDCEKGPEAHGGTNAADSARCQASRFALRPRSWRETLQPTGVTELIDEVRERFGPKTVVTDRSDVEPWLTDWRGRFHGEAAAILSPGSTEEAAAIVRLAAEHRVPLVPQGGNTSMVGGATPPADGSALILSLRRMNRLRSIESGMAVAEAGMILADLHDRADGNGPALPADARRPRELHRSAGSRRPMPAGRRC